MGVRQRQTRSPKAAATRSEVHIALGAAVREFRTAAGLSQDALAERSDMHRTYIGGIERGERNVSFTNLRRLADALGVRVSEVVMRAEAIEHGRNSNGQ